MQIDMDKQLVKVGSLVMWNRQHSEDYGCMGVVIEHCLEKDDDDEFFTEVVVLWADNDRCVYDYEDIQREHIKVVRF